MAERWIWPESLDLYDLEILLAAATVVFYFLDNILKLDGVWTVPLGSLITVAIVDKIIKEDLARKGLKTSKEENSDFLRYLCESRVQFIHLAAPLANAKRWAETYNDQVLKEITELGLKLFDGIVREQDNLSIHSSLIKGYLPPIVESRKNEYLDSLRRLRIAARNLMLPKNPNDRRNELNLFEIARGNAIEDRDLLINALYKEIGTEAAQDICKAVGFGKNFFAESK
ncbi:MAG: hypothetical protein WBL87_00045 [Methanothrix sp.]